MYFSISRTTLRRTLIGLLVVGSLIGFYFLGDHLTPRDAEGRPLILSPSVRKAERYRRSVLDWLEVMEEVDAGVEGLLVQEESTDPAQLYDLSNQAQRMVKQAAGVVREVQFTSAPPALVGLREEARVAAEAYFKAAQAAALWVGAPKEENLKAVYNALQQARELREQLERSRWLDEKGESDVQG